MHESPRSRLLAYGVALPILVLALILRWRFHSVLGERALYSSFIPAVMIAAYFGGFWPGFVVTLASAIASNYFIVEPRFTLQLKGTGDDVAMFLFVLSGTFISVLSESLHRARRRIVADERRRAEDALRDTEERFRQLAENIHEIFWMADLGHTRITYVSPAFDQVWGRTAQSLYDHPRSWLESIHPDDRAAVIENMEQRQHGVFNDLEFRIVRPDGAIRWLRSRAFPINDLESGAISRVAGLVEDITYRKRAEAELRQAKERLELAVRGSNVGIWDNETPDGDPDYGHLQYMNVWEQLGYDGPPHAEAVALDLAHPEDRARAFEAGRRYLAGENNEFEMEVRYSHKDGSDRIMLQRGAAVRDAAGKLIRLTGVIIDITRLKHAEEALRASEWRFRALVQNSSDIISLFDAEGTILYQSPSIERLLGYPPQDRIGHNIFSDPIVHPDDLEAKRAFFNKARSRPGVLVTAEFRMRHADGSWRDMEAIGQNFLEDPGVAGIVANYRDITERKRAEDAMRSSDARMRQLVSLMPAAVYTCDAEGRLTFYNRRAAELWGREPQLVTDDSRFCGSVRLWKLDGSPLPHELTPIASCIRDGRSTRNTEVVIEQPDGKRVIVSVNIEALYSLDGGRAGAINVFEDITERKRAEEAVQRLAALLRLSDDAIVVWRLDGGIESWSRGAEELYGFTEGEALGRGSHELLRTVHPVPWSEIETKLRAGGSWEGELRHRTKDGREVIVSTRHQLVRDADGAWRVLECNRDITDRKRDEALLDGQKRILELIIQGEPLPDVLAVLCRTIEDLTTEAEMLASVLLLDADGVHVRHGAAPSLPQSYIRAIDGLPIGPSAGSCGTAAYRREPVYVSDIASDPLWAQYAGLALSHNLRACWSAPILSSTGGVLGTFAMYYRQPRQPTARDLRTVDIVTRTVAIAIEQSRAEEALRVSEERFRTLAKATNDAVWDWDFASNKVWWNEGVFTLFGYVLEANEADPTWWLERIHPDDREAVETFFHGVVHGHELSWVDEYRFRCADGSYKDVYDRGYVIRDAEGRAVRMIGAMLDITARKRAEEALRESEQRWRDLTQALPQFVWTARPDGFMDYGSPQIEQYMGRPESDVLGWGWLEMLHPDDQARTQQAWQAAVEAKQSEYEIEHRFRRFDGAYLWFKTRGVVVPDSRGDSYKWFGTSTDITTVKQHEEELRLANERLHLGLFNSNIAIWEVDMPEGDFQRGRRYYANAWEQLGYERSEVPPDAPLMSEARVHPDERAAVKEAIRKYLAGETDKFELEHRLLHKDGSYRCMLTRGVAVRDAGGKPIRFIGSAVDITDRKRLEEELRRAKEAAEAANRAKDEFLANVSHEIRTPMNAILGMTELVLEAPLGDDQRQSLKTVKSAADNLLGIINDLLDFSKIEAGKLELDAGDFSLRAAVGDTLRALAMRAHRKGLELVCNVHADAPDALIGDAGRLRQVLLNLVGNAIKFTESGEVVVQVDAAGELAPNGDGNGNGNGNGNGGGDVILRFAVRDTGIGIPREKQSTIFRAFEQEDTSTTRKYGGTGLGLTISAQLAALMGGSIAVESEVNRGSTFSFTARFGRQANQPLAVAAAPPVLLHNLRVLVVDDNAANRDIMELWLRDWQMEPTSVGDGMAAMDALWHGVAIGKPHALVLLDARMPDTDGLTLAAKIRERAELSRSRIILLTSGDRPGDLARFRELRVEGHLLKPVQQDELLDTIYSIMSRTTERMKAEGSRMNEDKKLEPPSDSSLPLRILVAEDSDFNAQLMEKLLAKRGHTVKVASNGRQALALANAADFDLLLLDVHMPEMDGFEVIQAVRAREQTTGAHLPVIALTARSRNEDREHCLAAGMDGFLAKPIKVDDLWTTIDSVLAAFPSADRGDNGLLDSRVLLAACGGDEAILRGICQGLRTTLPVQLATIRNALEHQHAADLRESAHKLCGMVAAFSTMAGRVASDIEDFAARGQLEEARPLVEQLHTIGDQLVKAVSDDLSVERLQHQV